MNVARRGTAAVICVIGLFSGGCGEKKVATSRSAGPAEMSARESEASLLVTLETAPDFERVKAALTQLDAIDLSVKDRPQPSADDVKETARTLRLTEAEAGEYAQKTFTPADAAYLDQSLLLRAAVRALDLSGKTPPEQARLVFEWVCRTVYVSDRVPYPGAPGLTLEAGQGTVLGRAYLMLAAWQQIGLTGCFIGPKAFTGAAPFAPSQVPGEPATTAPVKLCGVKVGKDLFLFNPATGEALPGPAGKGPATWAELTANFELAKDIAGVGQISQWQVFCAAPLQSLTARMAWLQERDPGHVGVAVAVDLPKVIKEFRTDIGTPAVHLWLPETDPLAVSPWRVTERYTEGERRAGQPTPLRDEHKIQLVPLELLPQTNLAGLPLGSIRFEYAVPFMNLHYGQNAAMQRLIRGQFKEATSQLSEVRANADAAKVRAGQDPQLKADFAKWGDTLQNLSANVERAKKNDPAAEPAARQALDQFVRQPRNADTQRAWVMGHAARPLVAETSYLLALCVHERTLRLQARSAAADPAAWKVVLDWWDRYLDASAQVSAPVKGRDEQAKRLRAQAVALSAKK